MTGTVNESDLGRASRQTDGFGWVLILIGIVAFAVIALS